MTALVSTEWLEAHLDGPNLRIADASWYLPAAGRDPRAEYEAARIPVAVYFDIDAISDPAAGLPHMLPDAIAFASAMRRLGIGDADMVVFYDGAGIYSAPRALWMMRAMGHRDAAVLDGGLPKWTRENRPLEHRSQGVPAIGHRHFTPRPDPALVRDLAAMKANIGSRAEQVIDARSPARFRGEEQEPRPGVKPGHMPGSINVHYAEIVAPDGTMLSASALKALFAGRGIDLKRPLVTSCGSGVTAAILSLALERAGAESVALYDGSWSEWGAAPGAPIVTGP
jgi:thiosulfate/3-mercaptopyruvate sulfurtransferase